MQLRRSEFIEFLENNANVPVGVVADPNSCPLATYLNKVGTDMTYVAVGGNRLYYTSKKNNHTYRRRLPLWAQRFVDSVDKRMTDVVLTGEEALDIIKGVR